MVTRYLLFLPFLFIGMTRVNTQADWTIVGSEPIVIGQDFRLTCDCKTPNTSYVMWMKNGNGITVIVGQTCTTTGSVDTTYTYTCSQNRRYFYLTIPAENMTLHHQNTSWKCVNPLAPEFVSNEYVLILPENSTTTTTTPLVAPSASESTTLRAKTLFLPLDDDGNTTLTAGIGAQVAIQSCDFSPPTYVVDFIDAETDQPLFLLGQYIGALGHDREGICGIKNLYVNGTVVIRFLVQPALISKKVRVKVSLESDPTFIVISKHTYVFPAPYYIKGSSDYADPGENFTFTCAVTDEYPPISWTVFGEESPVAIVYIRQDNGLCFAYRSNTSFIYGCQPANKTYTLTITGQYVTDDLHRSQWRCTKHAFEPVGSAFYDLHIRGVLDINITSMEIIPDDSVMENTYVVITCKLSNTIYSTLVWLKENETSRISVKEDGNTIQSSLIISAVSCHDTANYTCIVKARDGSQLSQTTRLDVLCPPRFHQCFNEYAVEEFFDNERLNISLTVTANPDPTIHFRRTANSSHISIIPNFETRHVGVNIIVSFKNMPSEDIFGIYNLTVTNDFGADVCVFRIFDNRGTAEASKNAASGATGIIIAVVVIIGLAICGTIVIWRRHKRLRQPDNGGQAESEAEGQLDDSNYATLNPEFIGIEENLYSANGDGSTTADQVEVSNYEALNTAFGTEEHRYLAVVTGNPSTGTEDLVTNTHPIQNISSPIDARQSHQNLLSDIHQYTTIIADDEYQNTRLADQ